MFAVLVLPFLPVAARPLGGRTRGGEGGRRVCVGRRRRPWPLVFLLVLARGPLDRLRRWGVRLLNGGRRPHGPCSRFFCLPVRSCRGRMARRGRSGECRQFGREVCLTLLAFFLAGESMLLPICTSPIRTYRARIILCAYTAGQASVVLVCRSVLHKPLATHTSRGFRGS